MRRCALGPLLIHCQEHIVNQAVLLHFPNHLYPYRYTWHFWFPVKNIYSHPGVPCTDLKLLVVPFQEQYQPTSCTWNCSVFSNCLSLVKKTNSDDQAQFITLSSLSRTLFDIQMYLALFLHFWYPIRNIINHRGIPGIVPQLVVPCQQHYQSSWCTFHCSFLFLFPCQ